MAHRIDIRFRRPIALDEVHRVRNFIEDVWVWASRNGWLALCDMDDHLNPMNDFGFCFPARRSHEVTSHVEATVEGHFMQPLVAIEHRKKAPAYG